MRRVVILILAGFFLFGCTQKGNTDNSVIAEVNKTVITKEDFLKEISRLPEWARDRFHDKEGKKQFLEEMIKRELVYQEAEKRGLHKDKDFIAKVEEFKRMTLLSAILEKEIGEKAVVDDAEARDYYNKNPNEFKTDTIRASHILVDTEEEARNILEKIKKGEDFSKLAESFSKDKGTAQRGGDLGFLGRGRTVPEFENAAFNLKSGEISAPVKTHFGYHIIKVFDKKEGSQLDFEQVKDKIKKQLISEKQREALESFIKGLTEKSDIKKNIEVLDKISLPWEKGTEQAQ